MEPEDLFADEAMLKLVELARAGDVQGIRDQNAASGALNERGEGDVTLLLWGLIEAGVGDRTAFDALAAAGADPCIPAVNGFSPLTMAARVPDPGFLQTLLANGADPNHADADGTPLLHHSIQGLTFENMRILLAAGADINQVDGFGNTPVLQSAILGFYNEVFSLLEAGADRDPASKTGETLRAHAELEHPMLTDEQAGWLKKVRTLLEC